MDNYIFKVEFQKPLEEKVNELLKDEELIESKTDGEEIIKKYRIWGQNKAENLRS